MRAKSFPRVLAFVLVFASAPLLQCRHADPPPGQPETREATSPADLIARESAGPVRLGMTIAEARKAMPRLSFARTTGADGVAMVELRDGETLEMMLYAGEGDPESPIDEQARVEVINVFGERYKTAEGVHPGMPLAEVETRYGKLNKIAMSEIESHEYAEFSNAPAGLLFQVGPTENGAAGQYAEGQRETKSYRPSAAVTNIEIMGAPGNP